MPRAFAAKKSRNEDGLHVMTTVDFYFDFSCPWSYLALVRLRDVTDRNGAVIRFKPMSVQQLLATENPGLQASRLSENPA